MESKDTMEPEDCSSLDEFCELVSGGGVDSAVLVAEKLRDLWKRRDARAWARYPNRFVALAETLYSKGLPFLAYDVAGEGLKFSDDVVRLTQLRALALAQTGAPLAAQRLLEPLVAEGHDDSETLGILARTHKDRWRTASPGPERNRHLETAYEYYLAAFAKNHDGYPGINAAALCVFRGDHGEARRLAEEVRDLCRREIEEDAATYWSLATLGEASLILGELDAAREWFAKAIAAAPDDLASISSTRRQALRLLLGLEEEPGALDGVFAAPAVAVFTGHRVDAPARPAPRFPDSECERVKQEIAAKLDQWDAKIGYVSAASGGDILFIEAMLGRGGQVHIVLPTDTETFRQSSVLDGADPSWGERFDTVLKQAASVTHLSRDDPRGGGTIYSYTNGVLLGLARLHAKQLDGKVKALAVWDEATGAGEGGTAHCVGVWREAGAEVEIIRSLVGASAPLEKETAAGSGGGGGSDEPTGQVVKAALFADVVGYSTVAEAEIPAYLEHFMSRVAALCERSDCRPEVKNTWGDAFYFVFASVREAGLFALELREIVAETDWLGLGFAQPFRIRIGLHAGPVFPCVDPVTGLKTYTGRHVSRAARIEPIVEENQIFASQSFAALAAFEGAAELEFEYAGERSLAKGFGQAKLCILHPAAIALS